MHPVTSVSGLIDSNFKSKNESEIAAAPGRAGWLKTKETGSELAWARHTLALIRDWDGWQNAVRRLGR